ncbi:BTAD domain-containing putative transcriptional regulator [Streptacidiphilus sp. N1-10]|uniref:BTAD domain-containing putative transcriptional regulator n=1 Tax=Streptacidiphilus jeojiensis TaxID=3229225 RepID=A0ABV6Y0P2_9ACTN
MDFRVLGPVEAHRDGARVALSGSKVHTVLAALVLARGRVVSDARLNSLLWGWEPPATAGAQIYTYMSRLRKLLGDEVAIERLQPGYVLKAPRARVDLLEFERLDRQGRAALARQHYAEAGALLAEALGQWRGPALANASESLVESEQPQLEEARMYALESRIEADLALGLHEQLTAELLGLVARFPLRERLRAQLMTAFYRCGRQGDALQCYYEGRSLLADQLGIDPGEALGSTYQAVLEGNRGPGPGAPVRPPAGSAVFEGAGAPAMLPPDNDDFTGREEELAFLLARLGSDEAPPRARRLLVTGMTGVGKTALALRAAQLSTAHFPDGQLFAELTGPDGRPKHPAEVLVGLLRGMGEHIGTGPGGSPDADGRMELEELVRRYRTRTAGRRMLVLLDGAADSRQVEPLLPGTAGAVVLITGRTRLTRVGGAQTCSLAPFEDRAAFDLLASLAGRARLLAEPEATEELLAHCAGLPLALRIAGSRLAARPYWPVARLASRLADPGDRLSELSFGGLELEAVLLSALRQVPEPAEATLGRLAGIGSGPFPAQAAAIRLGLTEAAAEYCLEQLVDGALLNICGVDRQGRPLYRFHELVLLLAESPELVRLAEEPTAVG